MEGLQCHPNKFNKKEKNSCIAKETISKPKRQPTEGEKIVANNTSNKGLISNIYKELTQLNNMKTSDLFLWILRLYIFLQTILDNFSPPISPNIIILKKQ